MPEAVRLRIGPAAGTSLPPLGIGLWADRPVAPAAIGEQLHHLCPNHVDLLVDLRQTAALDRLTESLTPCTARAVPIWLYVVAPDIQPRPALNALARRLSEYAGSVAGMLLTPAAYLASYQPNGEWPRSASPAELLAIGRDIWPTMRLGGGFPTYFTELNRCRPDPATIDFLTHATSPVVHAADDISVMESLESLPYIFASARALAPETTYRLTTSAIGAWTNPYGRTLTPNPERKRLTLNDNDPRQHGLFAAAWSLAYMAGAAGRVDALTLSSIGAPFAIAATDRRYPVFDVLRGLNRGAGRPLVTVAAYDTPVAAVGWHDPAGGGELWLANTAFEPIAIAIDNARIQTVAVLDETTPEGNRILGDWPLDALEATNETMLTLRPFAVARLRIDEL